MFELTCQVCGKIQQPKSVTDNFKTYDMKCHYCGGKVDIKLKDKKKNDNKNS